MDLLTDCPIPPLEGETYGDAVKWSVSLVTALKQCNAKIAALRETESNRCPNEG